VWDKLIRSAIEELMRREGVFMVHIMVHPTFIAERDDWNRFESLIEDLSSYNLINLTVSDFVKRMASVNV
jgi:hypothetical protein